MDSRLSEQVQIVELRASRKRPIIPDVGEILNKSTQAKEGYLKLMRTAYEMVLNPNMSHRNFEVIVKCMRINGVRKTITKLVR